MLWIVQITNRHYSVCLHTDFSKNVFKAFAVLVIPILNIIRVKVRCHGEVCILCWLVTSDVCFVIVGKTENSVYNLVINNDLTISMNIFSQQSTFKLKYKIFDFFKGLLSSFFNSFSIKYNVDVIIEKWSSAGLLC